MIEPQYKSENTELYLGDALSVLQSLPDESVQMCVTSPPYWNLRDYGVEGQLGLEKTPEEYVAKLVEIFREVRRVLRPDGVLWVNLGDSYASSTKSDNRTPEERAKSSTLGPKRDGLGGGNAAHMAVSFGTRKVESGLKPKDLCMIPAQVAIALRNDGWYLRSDCIWHKPNCMPESVTDRPSTAHEYIFLLSKSQKYFYDQEAILEPVSLNTHMRLSQDLANQIGSHRANGGKKSNGPMKEVGRKASQGEIGVVKANSSFEQATCLPVSQRNKRTVWTVPTSGFSEAHFAVFPPKLIEPCILAGSSEHGCCSKCGAPWKRMIERGEPIHQHWAPGTQRKIPIAQGPHGVTSVFNTGFISPKVGVDWEPTCSCNAEVVPCTILDPFIGSGTTALVSYKLGRRCIGIELNPDYLKMASDRISKAEQQTRMLL